jgi:predicted metalloprotease with PDZ domain
MIRHRSGLVILLFLCCSSALHPQTTAAYPGTIGLFVDAGDAPAKLFHATLSIPVAPGPLTLLYPKWIPGEHGPTGPINGLTGLKFTAGGQALQWRRDEVDTFALHVTIPEGARELQVALDYASPPELRQGFTAGTTATAQMAVLGWNWVLLYPAGFPADRVMYRASLRLPAGWQFGTPLPQETRAGDTVNFQPASLYTLVDSPVLAGRFYRVIPLTQPGAWPPAEIDVASDSAAALQMDRQLERHYRQLVAEAAGLFGAIHYRDYHFLFSLSDHVASFGLEHHESNDSRTRERAFLDPQLTLLMAGLLPHEYTHSWNGKYRRPAGLATPNYAEPMKGELLWVYEGLTNYLGNVLTARSGLQTPAQYRDVLASAAAEMEYRSGRNWRPLQDTAIDAQDLYDASEGWTNWRRSVDFYPEGDLIWLDADMTIRNLSGGKKSLDDFCKLFFGPPSLGRDQAPFVKPYTFDDLVSALDQVAHYDWRKFWNDRLWSTASHAPLGGVEAAGWRLAFDESPSELTRAEETVSKATDLTWSLGLILNNEDGRIADVVFGSAAARAGIIPGMRLIAVNERAYSPDILHDALTAAKNSTEPLRLLVENTEYFRTVAVDYHGGNRYPHLEPNGKPDVLGDIVKQHAAGAP